MSKYRDLIDFPPKLEVKENAREIIINCISAMCDNKEKISLKKNSEGDFKINTHGQAFSNFLIKFDRDDIEWEADDDNWDNVFRMVNSGKTKIDNIKSR